jgi:hypothetical protein
VLGVSIIPQGWQYSFDMHGVLANNWRSLLRLLDLTVCILLKSENSKEEIIELIMNLDEDTQMELQSIIERSFQIIGGEEEQETYNQLFDQLSRDNSP